MASDYDDYDDRPRRRRRPEYDDYGDDGGYPRLPERSGWGIAVAVINLIAGSITTLGGGFISFIAVILMFSGRGRDRDESVIVFAFAFPAFLLGVGYLVSGFGVIGRRNWGRVLTLILGAFNFLLAAFGLLGMVYAFANPPNRRDDLIPIIIFSCFGVVMNLGYGVFVYMVLLRARIAEEFR